MNKNTIIVEIKTKSSAATLPLVKLFSILLSNRIELLLNLNYKVMKNLYAAWTGIEK